MTSLFRVPRAEERAKQLSKDRLKSENKYYQEQLNGIGVFDQNAQLALDEALTYNAAEKHFQEHMMSYTTTFLQARADAVKTYLPTGVAPEDATEDEVKVAEAAACASNSSFCTGTTERFTNVSNKTLYEFNLNKTMTYNQAKNTCTEKNLELASKNDVIDSFKYQNKFNGQNVWTPVNDSDNTWVQIGNKVNNFSQVENNPTWSNSNTTQDFKKNFYVEKDEIDFCDNDYDIDKFNEVITDINNFEPSYTIEKNLQKYGIDSDDKDGHIFGLTRYGPTVDKPGIFEYPVGIDVVIISRSGLTKPTNEEIVEKYGTEPADLLNEEDTKLNIFLQGDGDSNYKDLIDESCVWQIYRVKGVTTHDMDYLRDLDLNNTTRKSMDGMLYAIKNKKTGKYLKNSFDHSSTSSNFLYDNNFIPSTCSWIIK